MEGDLTWQCELQLYGALHVHIIGCSTLVSDGIMIVHFVALSKQNDQATHQQVKWQSK